MKYVEKASATSVYPKTVKRAIRNISYARRVQRNKPLISEKNRKPRLDFTIKYKDKGKDFCRTVLFTDESKFSLFGSDGRGRILRKPGKALQIKNLRPNVKHGDGNMMV